MCLLQSYLLEMWACLFLTTSLSLLAMYLFHSVQPTRRLHAKTGKTRCQQAGLCASLKSKTCICPLKRVMLKLRFKKNKVFLKILKRTSFLHLGSEKNFTKGPGPATGLVCAARVHLLFVATFIKIGSICIFCP